MDNTGSGRVALCSIEDVADGEALRVEYEDRALAVFRLGDEFFVTDDLCTHGAASLSEGYIDGDVVVCLFHEGGFNIKTGEVAAAPCTVPLRTYPTTIENGLVTIQI